MKKLIITILAVSMALLSATVVFAKEEKEYDYYIDSCWINETGGKIEAEWEKAESSTSYKLALYRQANESASAKRVKIQTVTSHKKDISDLIAKAGKGIYFVTVHPTKGGEEYMVESDTIEVDADYLKRIKEYVLTGETKEPESKTAAVTQSWTRDSLGNWYLSENDNIIKNRWAMSSGKWYLFDAQGRMQKGWQQWDGKWYYLEPTGTQKYPEGAMWANDITPDGYRVGPDGDWKQ